MPTNTAVWLVAEKARPFEVRPAPYTAPGEHEIVVKSAAVAINTVDSVIQFLAPSLFPTTYPTVLGHDVAGEVVEIGSSVTRFRVGDRVLGNGVGLNERNCESTFQEYVVLHDNMASQIPSTMSYEAAAVIPLCFSSAACGMYQKGHLALQYPSVNPTPTSQALLVWGGASSVGSNGIQLGVSSGYEVLTTASPKNFDYCKKLGASQVFDYHSNTVVEELVDALKGKTIAGALDCITENGAAEACAEVLRQSQGRKFMATVRVLPEELPGVETRWIYGSDLKDNEVGKIVYEDYLPKALAEGKFVPAPDPVIVGKGLHSIQDGVDAKLKGLSAQKLVITLSFQHLGSGLS